MSAVVVVSPKQRYQLFKMSELIALQVSVVEWQRYINLERVQEIATSLGTQLRNGITQPILTGCLVLCREINETHKPLRILDGQHRFEALRILWEKNKIDLAVMCNIIDCENKAECKHYFKVTNHTLPLEVPEEPDLFILAKQVVDDLFQKFPLCFSSAAHPRRPHMSQDILAQKIAQAMPNVLWNRQQWVEKIIQLNARYQKAPLSTFLYPNDRPQTIEMALTSTKKKHNFVLGMFKYDWVETLVKEDTEIHKMDFRATKVKIPLAIRIATWNQQFGKDMRTGRCYVCNDPIQLENFDCSHLVAENNGGTTNVDNLRCCCRKCNTSCATQNLDEFKSKLTSSNPNTPSL